MADVVVLNQPRSVLERIGCTYEAISERNPRAVVVEVSGWGVTGPYAELSGNGTLGEAFAGLTDTLCDTHDAPSLSGAFLGDHLAALAGMIGTLAASYLRTCGGNVPGGMPRTCTWHCVTIWDRARSTGTLG